jgi:uncharacterized membrane protein YqjE
MHPLLRLAVTRPQLLLDHAAAYAELVSTEAGVVSAVWKRQALLNALALCCAALAAVLGGVALMLWAVVPTAQMQAPWALAVVPLVPLAGALCCLMLRVPAPGQPFAHVRQQVQADLAMLREVGAR